jgi:hypothetical protein
MVTGDEVMRQIPPSSPHPGQLPYLAPAKLG